MARGATTPTANTARPFRRLQPFCPVSRPTAWPKFAAQPLTDDKSRVPFNTESMVVAASRPPERRVRRAPLARSVQAPRLSVAVGVMLATLSGLGACQPNASVGVWRCSEEQAATAVGDASAPVTVPWSTGFEDGFCDYTELAGFCLAPGSYHLVTSPMPHSGHYAAAFSVNSEDAGGLQSRCVRQGALPLAAVYGAWYYIPAAETNSGNWNLFHFTGGDSFASGAMAGFLDVSLATVNGGLQTVVRGAGFVPIGNPTNPPAVPIGAWFELELYLKRAPGTGGEVALKQDGTTLFDATGITTDDSPLGQWFVGNLAATNALSPPDSTIYVDDVSISAAP
jgi:hypothetical protein